MRPDGRLTKDEKERLQAADALLVLGTEEDELAMDMVVVGKHARALATAEVPKLLPGAVLDKIGTPGAREMLEPREGHAATGGRWRTAAMLPREDPLGNLAKALASVDGGAGRFMRGNKYCVRLTVSAKPSKRAQLPRNSERMVRMA